MAKKKLTIDDLKDRREKVEDKVMRIRAVLESHKYEREKIYSPENKRRLTVQALREDEGKLKTKTHASLTRWRNEIIEGIGDSFDHRGTYTREFALRNARFFKEYEGSPATVEAKLAMLVSELIESTRRNGAEARAARYSAEDLAAETAIAAELGDVASVSIFMQEARGRTLSAEERIVIDLALKKLVLPEVDEAQSVYGELEGLVDESDALLELWQNPKSEMAAGRESLARFNRRKRAEQIVRETEEEGRRQEAEKAKAKQQAAFPMPAEEPGPQQSSAA